MIARVAHDMGVRCQILINSPQNGIYRAGEPVIGVAKLAIDEPTECKDVILSFISKGKCRWTEGSDNHRTTYTGTETYITRHVNITNKRPGETITLYGDYEYPFEFYIPEDAPTTFKDKNAAIAYGITLKLFKPSIFSFDDVFKAQVPINGFVDILNSDGRPIPEGPCVFGVQKSVFTMFGNKNSTITLKAVIKNPRLTPGENAHISCVVINQSNVAVSGLTAELFCYNKYTADCGRTYKIMKMVKRCKADMPGTPSGETSYYSCVVPTLLGCYSIQNSRIVSKEYKVRVTVRLPVPRINSYVEVPVAIGVLKSSAGSDSNYNNDYEIEKPPSYWEVMTDA